MARGAWWVQSVELQSQTDWRPLSRHTQQLVALVNSSSLCPAFISQAHVLESVYFRNGRTCQVLSETWGSNKAKAGKGTHAYSWSLKTHREVKSPSPHPAPTFR